MYVDTFGCARFSLSLSLCPFVSRLLARSLAPLCMAVCVYGVVAGSSECANADNNAWLEKVGEAGRPIYNADNNCGPNLIFMSQSDLLSGPLSTGLFQSLRGPFLEIHCCTRTRDTHEGRP